MRINHVAYRGNGQRLAAILCGEGIETTGLHLDGENAWEYYPYNAYYFFEDLYTLIESDPQLRTTTCTHSSPTASQHTC